MIHHSIRTYGPRAFNFRAKKWFATAWIEKALMKGENGLQFARHGLDWEKAILEGANGLLDQFLWIHSLNGC